MGKSCILKLSSASNVIVGCAIPQVGVKNLYLMHAEDVTVTVNGSGQAVTATFAAGTSSTKVEGYKQNIQVTASALSTDAANRLAVSVTFKIPAGFEDFTRAVLIGKFYVLIEHNDGRYQMAGVQAPLECTSYEYDSNSGAGFITVTLSNPEGAPGGYLVMALTAAVDTIISKSV